MYGCAEETKKGTSVWWRVSVKCGEVREWWGVGDECVELEGFWSSFESVVGARAAAIEDSQLG